MSGIAGIMTANAEAPDARGLGALGRAPAGRGPDAGGEVRARVVKPATAASGMERQ